MDFVVGQRWVSHTEAQLGLGVISVVADRLITLNFPAVEEERSYAAGNAPLSRVVYKEGDVINTMDGDELTIEEVLENNSLLIYFGMDEAGDSHIVPESKLDCFVQFTSPVQRLFSSQLDRGDAFRLRVKTLEQRHRLQQSGVTGLMGSRTNLLPHQIYIANEVAQRYAPRVLLADEVGLGKTIEAGMVIHQQLHTGLASRVLLVLPPSLVHQWLVEMRRRFNLNFSIFDEMRLTIDADDDPFGEGGVAFCTARNRRHEPEQRQSTGSRKNGAADPMQNRNRHVRPPFPDRKVRRKRSVLGSGHRAYLRRLSILPPGNPPAGPEKCDTIFGRWNLHRLRASLRKLRHSASEAR